MGEGNRFKGVQTMVRVRPQLPRELQYDNVVHIEDKKVKVQKENQTFETSFEHVFPPTTTQDDVYNVVKGNVESLIMGYNTTIFAYGQTGTGKTYTMFGKLEENAADDSCVDTDAGVVIRALRDLFGLTRTKQAQNLHVQVTCSYMEIYNDRIHDLLQPYKPNSNRDPLDVQQRKTFLEVREDAVGNTYVPNLLSVPVAEFSAVYKLINKGNRNRAVRHTEMNQASSRSHSILQVAVEQWPQSASDGRVTKSKLNFVDLAGSERWNTNVVMCEDRINEMTAINSSLSTLALVVACLTEEAKYIPYRDSKLTHLLQDSLGGNCCTTIIATVSPSADAFEETCSTLKFADRARNIMNNAVVNAVLDTSAALALKDKEIARLRGMLAGMMSSTGGGSIPEDYLQELQERLTQTEAQMKSMQAELKEAKRRYTSETSLRSQLESELQQTLISLYGATALPSGPSTTSQMIHSLRGLRQGIAGSMQTGPAGILPPDYSLLGGGASLARTGSTMKAHTSPKSQSVRPQHVMNAWGEAEYSLQPTRVAKPVTVHHYPSAEALQDDLAYRDSRDRSLHTRKQWGIPVRQEPASNQSLPAFSPGPSPFNGDRYPSASRVPGMVYNTAVQSSTGTTSYTSPRQLFSSSPPRQAYTETSSSAGLSSAGEQRTGKDVYSQTYDHLMALAKAQLSESASLPPPAAQSWRDPSPDSSPTPHYPPTQQLPSAHHTSPLSSFPLHPSTSTPTTADSEANPLLQMLHASMAGSRAGWGRSSIIGSNPSSRHTSPQTFRLAELQAPRTAPGVVQQDGAGTHIGGTGTNTLVVSHDTSPVSSGRWGRSSFAGGPPMMPAAAAASSPSHGIPSPTHSLGSSRSSEVRHMPKVKSGSFDAGSWIYILGSRASSIKAKHIAHSMDLGNVKDGRIFHTSMMS